MSNCCKPITIRATCISIVGDTIQIETVPFISTPAQKYVICIDEIPLPAVPTGTNPAIVILNNGVTYPLFKTNGQDLTLRYFDLFKGFKCPRRSGILVSFAEFPIPLFIAYRGVGELKINCYDGYMPTAAAAEMAGGVDNA